MLPCIHFGLMKAHSSEEKYLHSASQVATFAQMTHKQAAPPLPFPIQTSLEGSGRRGARGGGGLLGEQNREGNKMLMNQPASPFPLPSVESMESVISHANPPPLSSQHLFRKVFGKSPCGPFTAPCRFGFLLV